MFGFFKRKQPERFNVGRGQIVLTLLDGTEVQGTSADGFISLGFISRGGHIASYHLEKQAASGLFKLAEGTYLARGQVRSARVVSSDYYVSEE